MKLIDFYTKEERTFEDNLNVYLCGPTVYNHAHIGNIRPIMVADLMTKLMSVKLVHNITDIDDKIIARAAQEGVSEKEISDKYEKAYLDLLEALNIKKPTHLPKVTENIDGMINFIAQLIEKGYAYQKNSSVYFSVKKLENYGKFANLDIDANKNAFSSEDKNDPEDFALWKSTDEGIQFDSPWGLGRPGWHTECSFFVDKYFGKEGVDIHGGGIDLKFPHHVNEMAQFDAYHNVESNNLWQYVGHITMDDQKMSKSIGNIILAKDFIQEYGYDVLRHMILSVNYLKPLNVNQDSIQNSKNAINKIKNAFVKSILLSIKEIEDIERVIDKEALDILNDNLDTPKLITRIYGLVDALNKSSQIKERNEIIGKLLFNLDLIGIEYTLNISKLKQDIIKAQESKNYETLDKLKEELVTC